MIYTTPKLALNDDEVHLWITVPEEITSPQLLSEYNNLLNTEERVRKKKFHFQKHRHQYLITWAMVRFVLSRYCDFAPKEWRFTRNKYGKPGIENTCTALRFNLSHTEGLAICGVIRGNEIGVDVENTLRDTQTMELAERFFSAIEYQELRALPREKQRDRFFDYWVLKESYIKACGLGLSIPLNQISFLFNKEGPIDYLIDPKGMCQPKSLKFSLMDYSKSHKIAICTNAAREDAPSRIILRHFAPMGNGEVIPHSSVVCFSSLLNHFER